ncbi:mannose-1-phosphate guanylyltransferase [Paenibacillus yonginensis]|uniref:Mannose-1-phosphate guanylyltransferase n=1 Tax=Paenibacillus yonginensis TaxID=1462996 RepID=A0A1B1MZT2_9BACL|nr:NDP-sugar synthase [Paenibacillus yonginensis]ANS74684.1 mannose-1-phosphate guanylyltransferase [Paenibacillus yonginensis]
MNVLLLAGGLGTRLRPLTEHMPKPMALVINRPWLEHLILHLKEQGVQRFVIALKHHPEKIKTYFGDGRKWGVSIQYAVERELLGTAGAIKNAEPLLDDRFVVINADVVHDTELKPLLEAHERHGGQVTIALKEVEDPTQFGVVELDETGRILRFVEKPRLKEAPSRLINAGIYVMDKKVLAAIPSHREVSIERETFPALIEGDAGVYGQRIEGYWADMGTKDRYRSLHWDLLRGASRLPVPGQDDGDGIRMGKGCKIGPGVLLVPPVLIGDHVRIGARSVIGPNVVLGDQCVIGPNVRLSDSILWNKCRVHEGAHLSNCIFGYGLELGSRHILHEAVMNRTGVMQA